PPRSSDKGKRNKEQGTRKAGECKSLFCLFPFAFFLAAMPTDLATWSDHLRRTLQCYDEALLRQVAGKLLRPRNHWPAAELIDRSLATLETPAVLDRRLADLDPAGRQVLALTGHSRQPRWPVGNLVEMLVALGQPDGLRPVL